MPGDEVTLVCPDGSRRPSEVVSASPRAVELRPSGEIVPPQAQAQHRLVLVQGMLKGQKMDLVIQKATELGAHAIAPAECDRTVLRQTRKHDRWAKVALEASRQCGRPKPPIVHEPAGFLQCIAEAKGAGVIFYEERGTPELGEADAARLAQSEEVIVAVGPEGGFTAAEVDAARGAGLMVRGLGPNILRAETASIAALAIVGYLLRRS